MNFTEKEKLLLKDMIDHEQLCIDKYAEYSQRANDKQLQDLFKDLEKTERQHLDTLNQMNSGTIPQMNQGKKKAMPEFTATYTEETPEKTDDQYLCTDSLSTEKQISSVYNTAVFEFVDTSARDVLNHIQKEEQEHGDKLFKYMSVNGMYSPEC